MGITKEQLGQAVTFLKKYADATSARHELWLNDYKTFGENSYVFNDKDIWNELLVDYELCMNDISINGICLDHASENNQVGVAISYIYGIDTTQWQSIATISDLLNDTTFINTIFTADNISKYMVLVMSFLKSTNSFEIISTNSTAMDCIMSNESIVNLIIRDDLIMNSIINNEDALMYMISTQASLEVLYENHELVTPYLSNSKLLITAANKAKDNDKITIWSTGCSISATDSLLKSNFNNEQFRDGTVLTLDRILIIYMDNGPSQYPRIYSLVETTDGIKKYYHNAAEQRVGFFINNKSLIHPACTLDYSQNFYSLDQNVYFYFINLDELHK